METGQDKAQQEAAKKLHEFVLKEFAKGTDKWTISQELVKLGIPEAEARQLVETLHEQTLQAAQKEQLTTASIGWGIIGGGIAALIGGIVWGLIAMATDSEIGFIAWGIGFLCGIGVVIAARGRKGVPLQVAAVLWSIFAILLGKYIYFFHAMKESLGNWSGEAASKISIFSPKVLQFFLENLRSMLSGHDIIWVVLAVITAWAIPRATKVKTWT